MAYKKSEKTIRVDENGVETTSEVTKSVMYERNDEPDYIKIYTKMWLEMNEIPQAYRGLFLELVGYMTYSYAPDLRKSQTVYTGKPYSESICKRLGWGQKMYEKALKGLVDCGAISRLYRGVYQINPNYAGKGEWLYNPKLSRGGIKDLKATFGLKDKTAEVQIIWADDGADDDFNGMYREGMGVKPSDETVLKHMVATPIPPEAEIESQEETTSQPSRPKTKEECQSHADCIWYVKFVQKKDKHGPAFFMAKELGLPTLSALEAKKVWDDLK